MNRYKQANTDGKPKGHKTRWLLLILVVIALVVAACSPSQQADPAVDEPKDEEPAETPEAVPEAEMAEAPSETEAEAPVEDSTEPTEDTAAEAPAETSAAPVEASAEVPAETPAAPVETPTEAPAETPAAPAEEIAEEPAVEEEEDDLPVFTIAQLAAYDGRDGRRAYVAVDGLVYDFTDLGLWSGGTHNGFTAGRDLTDALRNVSPHGDRVLSRAPIVGRLE